MNDWLVRNNLTITRKIEFIALTMKSSRIWQIGDCMRAGGIHWSHVMNDFEYWKTKRKEIDPYMGLGGKKFYQCHLMGMTTFKPVFI